MIVIENSINQNIKLCECKCGQPTKLFRGRYNRFISGHNSKGKNNPSWKGGRIIDQDGYVFLKKRNYFSSNNKGYVREHIFVFQEFYKCCLLNWGQIHHKDGNKQNNKIFNLLGLTSSQHSKIHHKCVDVSNRFCCVCLSDKTNGWLVIENNEEFLCSKCYKRFLYYS